MSYPGYIFDCDGTLADSMPIHHNAWVHALKKHGATFDFTFELMCQWGGKSFEQTVIDLNEMFNSSIDPVTAAADQAKYVESHLHSVKPKQEIVALAREFAKTSKVSVASGGHRDHVAITLKAIGVSDLFEVVVTQEDVERSKPAPDLFLLAAEKMGIESQLCCVYEDSPTGILAAKAAKMDYVHVEA